MTTSLNRSDADARLLLDIEARFLPESAAELGVTGVDEAIVDLAPGHVERWREAHELVKARLAERLRDEAEAAVHLELEILRDRTQLNIDAAALTLRLELPQYDVAKLAFGGVRQLLDDQVASARWPAALVRLRRYAGREGGAPPVAQLAEERVRERLSEAGRLFPFRGDLEKTLASSAAYLDGIAELCVHHRLVGFEDALAALRAQVASYEDFLKREILPRARTDFRLPAEIYAYRLRRSGIDMEVEELRSRARAAFQEIRNEMQALAPLVAREHKLDSSDYREVIQALKREQLDGVAILPHYQRRIAQLEELIARHGVVTLPERKMRMRLASEAESAAIPSPYMQPPRLIGNTGEAGTFVLPLRFPDRPGEAGLNFDDFTYDAASWTLTVHEGRPGHELQFATLVERALPMARTVFAENSVNIEGWALYCEAEMKPYMPLDGQLISLQHRLLRAARAFLDPGLHTGDLTPELAARVLSQDVVLSPGMVRQEVERYTFWAPAQAPSYFCGYVRLMALRAEVEQAMGARFDRARFHDFILAQGLVPPRLLRQAALAAFVPGRI